jgi:hypothetical protein
MSGILNALAVHLSAIRLTGAEKYVMGSKEKYSELPVQGD